MNDTAVLIRLEIEVAPDADPNIVAAQVITYAEGLAGVEYVEEVFGDD